MGNVVTTVVNVSNWVYNKTHETLDFLSVHLCPSRPSHKLATDNLHIPAEDLSVLMQIFNLLGEALGLVIVPFQMLNDKKFSVHIYETAIVFASPGAPQTQNTVNTCEKMLMYIAQNRSNIAEPIDKQIIKTVTIDNEDYDVPVNFWYSFEITTGSKVYFFAHISVMSHYKGVVIATRNDTATNLALMKSEALDFYDQTIGKKSAVYSTDKKMDFI